jgi:hypothetical protein
VEEDSEDAVLVLPDDGWTGLPGMVSGQSWKKELKNR